MEVGDQKRNVISLSTIQPLNPDIGAEWGSYFNRFPSKNEECLCSLRQKARELMHQYVLYFIRLLNFDTDPHAIDTGFDEHLLILVP